MSKPLAFPLALGLVVLLAFPARAEEPSRETLDTAEAVRKALGHREEAVRLAAVRAAEDLQDPALTAPLVRLLKDRELPVRLAAVAALAARTDPKARKAAALGLAGRLRGLSKSPEDQGELLVVVRALHDLAQPATLRALLDVSVNDSPDVVRARAMAAANVPSPEAIERLIQLGSRGRRHVGWRGIVREALGYATGATFTNDPDQWRQWWRDNEETFSFQAAAEQRAAARRAREAKERRQAEARRRRDAKRERQGEKRRPRGGEDDEE